MKVSFAQCSDYETARVEAALDRALAPLGGWETFVKPGQSVLLKPNLLTDREPERAVTTHPAVARAAIRAVKRIGAKPWVADSPNSVTKLGKVWDKTGFAALCAEEDVPLLNLEKAGAVSVRSGGFSFPVAKPVLDADVIVNLPKIKTHVLTILTGAVKNMYGAVPGFSKTTLHKQYPRPREFGKLVREICRAVKPALTIADAVIGMEGDGPSGGEPVRMGFLAVSPDADALDLTVCRALGIRPASVPTLRPYLKERAAAEIETVGDPLETLMERPIKVPSTFRGQMIPGPFVKLIGRILWIRPAFSEACVRCGLCVKACPVAALALPDGASRPVLEGKRCIGCCCCHEICPQRAVTMRSSPLLNLFRGGRPM